VEIFGLVSLLRLQIGKKPQKPPFNSKAKHFYTTLRKEGKKATQIRKKENAKNFHEPLRPGILPGTSRSPNPAPTRRGPAKPSRKQLHQANNTALRKIMCVSVANGKPFKNSELSVKYGRTYF